MDFEDPELAKEMIKLLGQELKLLRAQLSDANQRPLAEGSSSITLERTHLADAENARLKAQIRELESRVVQPQHATGDTKHVLQLETALQKTTDQLAELSKEKDRLAAEKDAKISRLQEKYRSNREKYKAQKSANAKIQQECHDVEIKFEELRRESKVENIGSGGFNLQAFLASAPNREYPGGIQPYTKDPSRIRFSEDAREMLYNAAPETLHYTDREVLWSGDNISRVVAILPLHRYNPKSLGGVGTWEQTNKPYQGKKCNLFYRFQNVWSYMGTFLCVQATPIESDQLSVTSLLVKQMVYQRTILFPDLVPKFLSDMVKGMYDKGALRAECLAFEFQSFDEKLNEQLLGSRYPARRTQHVPNPDVELKRSFDSSTSAKTSSKKRKTLKAY